MSIEKIQRDMWQVSCDFCENSEAFTGDNFSTMWAGAKDDGWRCFKDKDTGEWKHKCPACIEKWREDKEPDNGAAGTAPRDTAGQQDDGYVTDEELFGGDDGADPYLEDDFSGEEPFVAETPPVTTSPDDENPF